MFDWLARLMGCTINKYEVGDRVFFKSDLHYVTEKRPNPDVYVIRDKGKHVGYKVIRENSCLTRYGRSFWDFDFIDASNAPPNAPLIPPKTPQPKKIRVSTKSEMEVKLNE